MNPFTKIFKTREPTEQQEVSNKAVGSGYNFDVTKGCDNGTGVMTQ